MYYWSGTFARIVFRAAESLQSNAPTCVSYIEEARTLVRLFLIDESRSVFNSMNDQLSHNNPEAQIEEIESIDDAFTEMVVPTAPPGANDPSAHRSMSAPLNAPTVAPKTNAASLLAEQERERYHQNRTPFGGTPQVRIANMGEGERLAAPALSPIIPMTPEKAPHFAWLSTRPGVVGYVHTDAARKVVSQATPASGLELKLAFVRQVAQSIGAELGFENLRELHIASKESRALSVALDDGGSVDLQAAVQASTHELAKLVRG
jgi:hypothetical protein